ncbi:MAG: glycosyltransferase family 39 protein [Candidatus Gottesmanbacteria bacterium]
MNRIQIVLLLTIFFGAFIVRLYHINNPVADWHSWRQADTAAVARNFLKFGFTPLQPRYDDLSNVQSGKDNPQGFRMVEFPIYQTMAVALYQLLKFFGGISLEFCLRLISILASMGIMFFLYDLVKKYSGFLAAISSAFIFGFLPYCIYYSRVILPEMLAVFWALGGIWIALRFGISGKWRILGMGIFAGLAILTKPMAGFLLVPFIYFWLKEFKANLYYFLRIIIFSVFAFAGFAWWRIWILQYPEGIPANEWLLNSGNIRFSGAYFYWLLGERLAKLILGYWLVIPFLLGLISRSLQKSIVYLLLLIGTIFYAIVFARGNVQHDYYQIIWLPVISIFVGLGIDYLINSTNQLNRYLSIIAVIVCIVVGILFSWHDIRSYYWINNPAMVEAGLTVDRLTQKNAKVIAPYGGDTAFLYQTNRQGWPVGFEIEKKIALGANYYVNTNVKDLETQYVLKRWTPLVVNDRFVIVKLK